MTTLTGAPHASTCLRGGREWPCHLGECLVRAEIAIERVVTRCQHDGAGAVPVAA